MRVLFVIPHPREGASGRHRVFQYVPWLQRRGVVCHVRPFMSHALYRILYQPGKLLPKLALSTAALINRMTDLVRSSQSDVVVVHREALPLGTAWCERLMARLCPSVVFDFDDAIYLDHASGANAWTRLFRRADKTADIIAASTHVIAGNRFLEAYARRFNPHVSVIPTPVDTERFQRHRGTGARTRVVIGWMGSSTTAEYLGLVQPALAAVATRYPGTEIRIVGAGSVPLHVPNLRTLPWRLEQEVEELRGFDIGIMPMPDDEWARGKCGFKALLYMSVGLPVVSSPVGVNCEIIREGLNGFLASDEQTWVNRLSTLIEDRGLRDRMGQAGRTIVEEHYSVAVNAPRFFDVLQAAYARGRAAQGYGSDGRAG